MYRHAFYIILTLLSIVYATTPSIAQSIDHFTATVKYIQYPEIPLPEEMKDYRVVLSFDDQDLSAAERKTIAEKHLTLADRPINPNSPYLLLVQVGILNGETLEPEINSRDKKEGDKTVKVYSYAHRVRYWYPYTIRLTKPGSADDPIYAQNHAIESIYKTKIYPDEYTARKYFQDNKGAIIQEQRKVLSAKIPKQAAGYLESTFSTLEKTTQIHYRYIKNNKWKKHTYLNLEKAAQLAQKATDLKYISSENTSSELAEAIAIWQSELTNLDTTDKKSKINKKIGRALYANIAYARFGLDDMEGCIDACEDRLLLQGALGTGLPIEEMARTIERRYNENGK